MTAPARLASVIGQDALGRLLARLVARGKLPHAVLLEGTPGCGRRTVARALAAALLCQRPVAGDACGGCPACVQVAQGTHPDLLMFPAEGEDAAVDKELTDAVREMVESRAYESPLMGCGHVFVIPDLERLQRNQATAANALLKVLEEPPPATWFILTTAFASSVLRTIRSRAQLYRLQPLIAEDVERILVRGGVPAPIAARRAAASDGSHRGLWDDDVPEVPLAGLTSLLRDGWSTATIADLVAGLPTREREDGRTVAAEQRRICRLWLAALQQSLRRELVGPEGRAAADGIERVQQALRDLQRNLQPRLVLEALALPRH